MPRRRPRVDKAIRKQDVRKLLRALHHYDTVADSQGRLFDLAESVRTAAALGLAEIETTDREDIDRALSVALHDRAPRVRQAAATALAMRGARGCVTALVRAMVDWDGETYGAARTSALAALSDLAGPAEMPAIVETLAERATSTRTASETLAAVVASKDEQAVDAAATAAAAVLARGRPSEAACAAEMLLSLGTPSVDPLLVLARNGSTARRQAIAVLARLGDRRAVGPLSEALSDDDKAVRCAAANALGELADPAAVPALRAAMSDDDGAVRKAALSGLHRLGPAAQFASQGEASWSSS